MPHLEMPVLRKPVLRKPVLRKPSTPKPKIRKHPQGPKRYLQMELDLMDNDYKLLAVFATHKAALKYSHLLRDEGHYAQVVNRIRAKFQEFRIYAKPGTPGEEIILPDINGIYPQEQAPVSAWRR